MRVIRPSYSRVQHKSGASSKDLFGGALFDGGQVLWCCRAACNHMSTAEAAPGQTGSWNVLSLGSFELQVGFLLVAIPSKGECLYIYCFEHTIYTLDIR